MKPLPTNLILPFLLWIALSATRSEAQTPTPAFNIPFTFQLSDRSSANALFLPAANGAAYLVFSTKTGQIGFWLLQSSPTPTPPHPTPPPDPTPPPAPSGPRSLVTITETTPAAPSPIVLDAISAQNGSHFEFTEAMVALDEPPPNALKWIGKAAGKPKPYTFIVQSDGAIAWEGPTPPDAQIILLLPTKRPAAPPAGCCPTSNCPALLPRRDT